MFYPKMGATTDTTGPPRGWLVGRNNATQCEILLPSFYYYFLLLWMKVDTEMGNMMSIVWMLFRWFLIFHFLYRGYFIVKNRLLAFFGVWWGWDSFAWNLRCEIEWNWVMLENKLILQNWNFSAWWSSGTNSITGCEVTLFFIQRNSSKILSWFPSRSLLTFFRKNSFE